jgi:hypothetical protein
MRYAGIDDDDADARAGPPAWVREQVVEGWVAEKSGARLPAKRDCQRETGYVPAVSTARRKYPFACSSISYKNVQTCKFRTSYLCSIPCINPVPENAV